MQIIQVKPGADRQALALISRHMGLRVGIQGGMQVMIAETTKEKNGEQRDQHQTRNR